MNIRLEFFKVEFSKTNVSQIAQIEKKNQRELYRLSASFKSAH